MVDAAIDALRYVSMAVRSVIPQTGTPLDIVRDLMSATIRGSELTEHHKGVDRIWGAYDAVGEWVEQMRRGEWGARLTPRENTPIAFHVVSWFHFALVVFCVAFPLLFSRDRDLDLVYLSFVTLVVAHWFLLCGECVLSYLEKKLFFETYDLGSVRELHLHWFAEALSWQFYVVFLLSSLLGIYSAVTAVVLRNFSLDLSATASSVTATLRYLPLRAKV